MLEQELEHTKLELGLGNKLELELVKRSALELELDRIVVVVGMVFERVSVPTTTTSPTGFGPAFGTTGFGPAFGTTGEAALLKRPDMAVYV